MPADSLGVAEAGKAHTQQEIRRGRTSLNWVFGFGKPDELARLRSMTPGVLRNLHMMPGVLRNLQRVRFQTAAIVKCGPVHPTAVHQPGAPGMPAGTFAELKFRRELAQPRSRNLGESPTNSPVRWNINSEIDDQSTWAAGQETRTCDTTCPSPQREQRMAPLSQS